MPANKHACILYVIKQNLFFFNVSHSLFKFFNNRRCKRIKQIFTYKSNNVVKVYSVSVLTGVYAVAYFTKLIFRHYVFGNQKTINNEFSCGSEIQFMI